MSQKERIIEGVRQAHEAMRVLRREDVYSGFNSHILLAAMTVAYQLDKLNTTLEVIAEKLSDIAESGDFIASQSEIYNPSADYVIDYAYSLGLTPMSGESVPELWERVKQKCAEMRAKHG